LAGGVYAAAANAETIDRSGDISKKAGTHFMAEGVVVFTWIPAFAGMALLLSAILAVGIIPLSAHG
jgi:hypothetical protein